MARQSTAARAARGDAVAPVGRAARAVSKRLLYDDGELATETLRAEALRLSNAVVGCERAGIELLKHGAERSGIWSIEEEAGLRFNNCLAVSYTHLTLPTIYSV